MLLETNKIAVTSPMLSFLLFFTLSKAAGLRTAAHIRARIPFAWKTQSFNLVQVSLDGSYEVLLISMDKPYIGQAIESFATIDALEMARRVGG